MDCAHPSSGDFSPEHGRCGRAAAVGVVHPPSFVGTIRETCRRKFHLLHSCPPLPSRQLPGEDDKGKIVASATSGEVEQVRPDDAGGLDMRSQS
ncbi:MAG: hypothetical protein ACPIOQ_83410, partial [Promethearchaeia archaeon]